MYPRKLLFASVSTLNLILVASCSESPVKKTAKVPAVVGSHYTTIVFSPGKSHLSSDSKENLKKITEKAHRSKRSIEEIHVLAWSDIEYPDEVESKATKSDISLASERAQQIKDYLQDDLKETKDIDSYNMAKRPNILSKILRNDEYEIKEAFDLSGATGSKLPDGSVSYTKASKALVIIDYVGDEDNLK